MQNTFREKSETESGEDDTLTLGNSMVLRGDKFLQPLCTDSALFHYLISFYVKRYETVRKGCHTLDSRCFGHMLQWTLHIAEDCSFYNTLRFLEPCAAFAFSYCYSPADEQNLFLFVKVPHKKVMLLLAFPFLRSMEATASAGFRLPRTIGSVLGASGTGGERPVADPGATDTTRRSSISRSANQRH